MKSHGSVLLPLLLLVSAAIVCSIHIWKSSLLLADIMHNKEYYYQYHYATEGLLRCGLTIASYNKDQLINHAGLSATVTFMQWPITDTKTGVGTITMSAKTQSLLVVRSQLYVDNNLVCVRACELHGTQDSTTTISAWSTDYV